MPLQSSITCLTLGRDLIWNDDSEMDDKKVVMNNNDYDESNGKHTIFLSNG